MGQDIYFREQKSFGRYAEISAKWPYNEKAEKMKYSGQNIFFWSLT